MVGVRSAVYDERCRVQQRLGYFCGAEHEFDRMWGAKYGRRAPPLDAPPPDTAHSDEDSIITISFHWCRLESVSE